MGNIISCASCHGEERWAHYEGETGRDCFSRGLEHQEDLRSVKEDTTPLWKHGLPEHSEEKEIFIMKPLKNFSSCWQRQIIEAVGIPYSKVTVIMNSKVSGTSPLQLRY